MSFGQRATGVLGSLLLSAGLLAAQAPQPAAAAAPVAVDAATSSEQRGAAYAHLMRAMLAARRGEGRAAAAEIRKAVKLEPQSAALHVEAAELMQMIGRAAEAEELARGALALDPRNVDAARLLAEQASDRAFAGNGDAQAVAGALRQYEELAQLEPLGDASLRRKANLEMMAGDLDAATRTSGELFRQRPGDRDAAQLYARLLAHRDRDAEALDVLLQFLLRHPDDTAMIEEARRLAEALDAWASVAERLGGSDGLGRAVLPAQALRGEALYRLERHDEAATALERALEADPGNVPIRLRLAWTYRAMGRLADAAALAEELARERPDEPAFTLLLAETQHLQRDTESALAGYERALAQLAGRAEEEAAADRDAVRRRMADLRIEREEFDRAAHLVRELEDPGSPAALELAGRNALAREDWAELKSVARRLREADDAGTAALLEGEMLLRSGKVSKGVQRLEEALAKVAGEWRFFAVARVLHEHGQTARGEALLRGRASAAPNDPNAQFDLGRFLYLDDRLDDAEPALRRAFEIDPRHAPALNFLGYSFAERGVRLEEAQRLIEGAIAVNAWDGAYLDSLGWVRFQRGDYAAAREPLERAAREFPTDPVILEHLGDLYERLGEPVKARDAWGRALSSGAENPTGLQAKIARVGPAADAASGDGRSDLESRVESERPRRP